MTACTFRVGSRASALARTQTEWLAERLGDGVSLIWGVGQLESEITFCPAQAVIDNEILSWCRRCDRGVSTADDALAVDVTRAVGIAGSFLDTDHTLRHFRGELWEPSILFRNRRAVWDERGAPRLEDAAEAAADALIAAEGEPCLSEDQEKELRRIEADFLGRIGVDPR